MRCGATLDRLLRLISRFMIFGLPLEIAMNNACNWSGVRLVPIRLIETKEVGIKDIS